ncbi:MAG: hypothetical protein J6Z02_00195 [Lachnospiraceae bacterium]|nr:hypothetical protein [Lachnospiraceae bacterium]
MESLSVSEKIEKIRKLSDRGKYEEALELADTVDSSKVKSLTELGALADVYDATGHYEEAYALLLRIYDKTRTRKIVYQLSCIAVKQKNTVAAERYYREFLEVAPTDSDQYVIRFLIDRLEKKDISEQIESLEKLKEEEYVEEWAFELARLYHKAGNVDKCVRECKDIMLWFGDGPIVDKARSLLEIYEGKQEIPARKPTASPEPEEDEDEGAEQLELELVTEDEDEGAEQLELELEEPEVKEEVAAEDETQGTADFTEDEPVAEIHEKEPCETPVEATDIPDDPLVVLGVELLREEDYIVTEDNIKEIAYTALEVREEYKEEDHPLQMTRRIKEVIDNAEKRSMKNLLDVVTNGSYATSEFLILKKEDFTN